MFKLIGIALVVMSLFGIAAVAAVALSQTYSANSDVPYQGPEQLSPSDRIDSGQIAVTANGLLIRGLTDVRLVNLADTNSMDPTLDVEATAIEIVPRSTSELHVGDIVSYQSGSDTIIHRIIDIGSDSDGWYAVVKGDNNAVADPGYVRFGQIKGVVVGIVY